MNRCDPPHGCRFSVPVSVALFLSVLLFPVIARAGEWRVTPIRLELGKNTKSGAVTVFNESEERLQVQMSAMEWTQDAQGKDRYEETSDILFFPRIMLFDKKEEKILRAGIKIPATEKEKTYRLFIKEIPGPVKAQGANIAIAIRFGVPVFVRPLKEDLHGELVGIGMSTGTLRVPVRNSGNVHFLIQGIRIRGKNPKGEVVFSKELNGWYLLAGASRSYTADVPADVCREIAGIDVEVRTDRIVLNGNLVADPSMCATK